VIALALVAVTPAAAHSEALAPAARFTCYPAQFSAFLPQRQTLVDQLTLTRQLFSVDLPERVCAPAAAEGESFGDASSYLTCYSARTAPFAPRDVRLRDGFGTTTLRLLRPVAVCMPSGPFDPYTCYAVQLSARQSGATLTVTDGIGSSKESVGFATRVCASTGVVRRPLLTCYGISSDVKGSTVVVKNAFGFLKAALGPRDQLCTSSTRV
jgi:hypothetical protein